jgi:hypothetical protein
MRGIYIGLGSNLGNRLDNLNKAVEALPPRVQKMAASPVYETVPWGYLEQPAFLNQVIEVETGLLPVDLLKYLKEIEQKLGRQPGYHRLWRLDFRPGWVGDPTSPHARARLCVEAAGGSGSRALPPGLRYDDPGSAA